MIVVLFSTKMRTEASVEEEAATSERMWEIVSAMPGFISYKAYTGESIAVVRFESREALEEWKREPDHRVAQERAREDFYQEYWVQACETFRSYRFTREAGYGEIPVEVFRKGSRVPAPASPVATE